MSDIEGSREINVDNFIGLLESHADKVLQTNSTNQRYADRVRRNAQKVRELLGAGSGDINGVVSTWREDFRPIAEAIFGIEVEPIATDQLLQSHASFTPTVIDGVLGRVHRISLDEIMGPLFTLDLVASE